MKTIKDIDEIEKDFINEADLQKEAKKEKPKGAVGRGRPRKANKATFQVYVNLTEDEKKAAEAKSEELGISLSALFKIGLKKVLDF